MRWKQTIIHKARMRKPTQLESELREEVKRPIGPVRECLPEAQLILDIQRARYAKPN